MIPRVYSYLLSHVVEQLVAFTSTETFIPNYLGMDDTYIYGWY